MLIAVIIAILIILIWFDHPHVHRRGGPLGPIVTILAGTHGNEPAPSLFLEQIVRNRDAFPRDSQFVIVPHVNPWACRFGVRSLWSDINRSWPSGHRINRRLQSLIDRSDLVIDFHEAWGFNTCQPQSLGQTIYSNHTSRRVTRAVDALNQHYSGCMQWRELDTLPHEDGTLDNYCTARRIPYVLVELAGQRDIVPRETRYAEMQILLRELADIR